MELIEDLELNLYKTDKLTFEKSLALSKKDTSTLKSLNLNLGKLIINYFYLFRSKERLIH